MLQTEWKIHEIYFAGGLAPCVMTEHLVLRHQHNVMTASIRDEFDEA